MSEKVIKNLNREIANLQVALKNCQEKDQTITVNMKPGVHMPVEEHYSAIKEREVVITALEAENKDLKSAQIIRKETVSDLEKDIIDLRGQLAERAEVKDHEYLVGEHASYKVENLELKKQLQRNLDATKFINDELAKEQQSNMDLTARYHNLRDGVEKLLMKH